jgi:biopolymer transport protein ExbD
MKIRAKFSKILEPDLTPMIDVCFQLIAFFMVLVNFSQVERNADIMLPESLLAKPPEEAPKAQIVLNLKSNGQIIVAGETIGKSTLMRPYLDREINDAARRQVSASDVSVIIRSHQDTPMRLVQDLISKCQDADLETFVLRVKEQLR